jgi:hypothetical protein
MISLAVVAIVLATSVAASLLWPRRHPPTIPPLAHIASEYHEHHSGADSGSDDAGRPAR